MSSFSSFGRRRVFGVRLRTWVIALVILFLGAAAYVVRHVLDERRERQLIVWADVNMSVHRYEDAAGLYARAAQHRPSDADLGDKWGDALYQASAARPAAAREARGAWELTLSRSPGHLPTLKRLLSLDAEFVDLSPSRQAFEDLAKIAEDVAGLDPSDAHAETLRRIAPIGVWLTAPAGSAPVEKATLVRQDAEFAQLAAHLDHNPADGTALSYYEMAALRRAWGMQRDGAAAKADALLQEAQRRVDDALHAPNANAATRFRAAQTLVGLAEVRRAAARTPAISADMETDATEDSRPAATQPVIEPAALAILRRARDAADQAARAADPKAHEFLDIRLLQAQLAAGLGDRPAAVETLKQTIAKRPDAVAARIVLAELQKSGDREAAIQLLAEARTAPGVEPGPSALVRQAMQTRATAREAALCVDAAAAAEDGNVRATQIDRARAACDRAHLTAGDTPGVLKSVARLRLLQGRPVDAIRTADFVTKAAGRQANAADPELSYVKALAFQALHEPQQAAGELRAALDVNGTLIRHRLLLAAILLSDGQTNDAAAQVSVLRQQTGDGDPRVVQLELALLRAQNGTAPSQQRVTEMNDWYRRLPEANAAEQRQKAWQAAAIGNTAEVGRLLRAARGPTTSPAAMPSGAAQATDDPFAQAMRAVRAALAQRDASPARQALDAARSIKPNAPDLFEAEFYCDLLEGRWDAADTARQKLAADNRDQMNGLSYAFQLALARGDAPGAVVAARELTRNFEPFSVSWLALGQALQASGQPREATDAYEHALTLEPANLLAMKGAAVCELLTGRPVDAAKWIAAGRKAAPDDPDFRAMEMRKQLELIRAYAQATPPQWDQVERLLAEARSAWPAAPDWDATEARMWQARGEAAKAAGLMHRAVLLAEFELPAASATQPATQPSDAQATVQREQLRQMIRDELAMLSAANDDVAIAREAARVIGRYGEADPAAAWAHFTLAIWLHRQTTADATSHAARELDAAMASARRAGDRTSGAELVQAIEGAFGPDEALRRLSGLRPSAAPTSSAFDRDLRFDLLRADLLRMAGNLHAAAAAIDALMPNLAKLPPEEQLESLRLAADVYSRTTPLPQIGKARDAYVALLDRAPEDLAALNNLAYLLLEQTTPPDPQQALAYSQRAYGVMQNGGAFDARIADTHGWALANAGRTREAIDVLAKVVEQLPTPETQDHLGEAYLMAGEAKEAASHLRAALDLLRQAEQNGQPSDPALRSRLVAAQRRVRKMQSTPAPADGQTASP